MVEKTTPMAAIQIAHEIYLGITNRHAIKGSDSLHAQCLSSMNFVMSVVVAVAVAPMKKRARRTKRNEKLPIARISAANTLDLRRYETHCTLSSNAREPRGEHVEGSTRVLKSPL
nr:hypothetical protein Iba_chr13eCG12050 [Ipomoea batatas]